MKNRDDDNYHDVDFDLNENAENNKCTIKTAIGFTIVTTILIELDAMRHYKNPVNICKVILLRYLINGDSIQINNCYFASMFAVHYGQLPAYPVYSQAHSIK